MPIQCGMLTGSLTLIIKTTVQACMTLLRASHAVGPCPQEFSILCSHYSKEDSKAWAGCVCVRIKMPKIFATGEDERKNVPATGRSWLFTFFFSVMQCNLFISVAHVSLSGNSAKGKKRRQRAQHGTRQVFLPQGKNRCQVICEWGVPDCWKVRYRIGDRKLWQEEGVVVFLENCLIVVVIKRKIDIPCFCTEWQLNTTLQPNSQHTALYYKNWLQRVLDQAFGTQAWSRVCQPIKSEKKNKRTMNQSSPYLLQILNQNHPSVHLIAREKGKNKKKRSFCVCGKISHLQYLKLLVNYLECTLKKCISLLRFTVSAAYICQPPALHVELGLQHLRCAETSFHPTLTRARKIRWFKLLLLQSKTHMELLP